MKATIITILGIFSNMLIANNLYIRNVTVNQTNKTVEFDISWENSWYLSSAPANWDAVWIIVKFKTCSDPPSVAFTHGTLSSTKADHVMTNLEPMTSVNWNGSAGSTSSVVQGATLDFTDGIMLRRKTVGTGNINDHVVLKITNLPAAGTDIKVQVIGFEMVYVPTGTYYLGDKSTASYSRPFGVNTSTGADPVLITSSFETSINNFYSPSGTYTNISASFPKGHYGFYCMKYEISAAAWETFYNTLSTAQQANMAPASFGSYRNQLFASSGVAAALRPHRAQNYLTWPLISAFLDWACLRPMTELEYEKHVEDHSIM